MAALFLHFPPRPSERQRRWPLYLSSFSSTATALQIPSTSPTATLKLFMQLASTLSEGTFAEALFYFPVPTYSVEEKKKDFDYFTSPQIAGKKRATSPLRCRRYSSRSCSISAAPNGKNSANKPFSSHPPVAEASEMRRLARLRR